MLVAKGRVHKAHSSASSSAPLNDSLPTLPFMLIALIVRPEIARDEYTAALVSARAGEWTQVGREYLRGGSASYRRGRLCNALSLVTSSCVPADATLDVSSRNASPVVIAPVVTCA